MAAVGNDQVDATDPHRTIADRHRRDAVESGEAGYQTFVNISAGNIHKHIRHEVFPMNGQRAVTSFEFAFALASFMSGDIVNI